MIGAAVFGRLLKDLDIDCSPHGFRSSFRSWCSDEGVDRELAEQALAHAVGGQVEQCYARSDVLERRRRSWRPGERSWSGRRRSRTSRLLWGSRAQLSSGGGRLAAGGVRDELQVQRVSQSHCVQEPKLPLFAPVERAPSPLIGQHPDHNASPHTDGYWSHQTRGDRSKARSCGQLPATNRRSRHGGPAQRLLPGLGHSPNLDGTCQRHTGHHNGKRIRRSGSNQSEAPAVRASWTALSSLN